MTDEQVRKMARNRADQTLVYMTGNGVLRWFKKRQASELLYMGYLKAINELLHKDRLVNASDRWSLSAADAIAFDLGEVICQRVDDVVGEIFSDTIGAKLDVAVHEACVEAVKMRLGISEPDDA